LWPQSSLSSNIGANNNTNSALLKAEPPLSTAAAPLIGNNFSESFFEKLALMEFETSVYNQLKSVKILCSYYEQIVYEQMKMLKQKPSSTIMVTPVKNAETAGNENNLLSAEVKNLNSVRKKLSLTILELGICKMMTL
jgi:hypothetical protein